MVVSGLISPLTVDDSIEVELEIPSVVGVAEPPGPISPRRQSRLRSLFSSKSTSRKQRRGFFKKLLTPRPQPVQTIAYRDEAATPISCVTSDAVVASPSAHGTTIELEILHEERDEDLSEEKREDPPVTDEAREATETPTPADVTPKEPADVTPKEPVPEETRQTDEKPSEGATDSPPAPTNDSEKEVADVEKDAEVDDNARKVEEPSAMVLSKTPTVDATTNETLTVDMPTSPRSGFDSFAYQVMVTFSKVVGSVTSPKSQKGTSTIEVNVKEAGKPAPVDLSVKPTGVAAESVQIESIIGTQADEQSDKADQTVATPEPVEEPPAQPEPVVEQNTAPSIQKADSSLLKVPSTLSRSQSFPSRTSMKSRSSNRSIIRKVSRSSPRVSFADSVEEEPFDEKLNKAATEPAVVMIRPSGSQQSIGTQTTEATDAVTQTEDELAEGELTPDIEPSSSRISVSSHRSSASRASRGSMRSARSQKSSASRQSAVASVRSSASQTSSTSVQGSQSRTSTIDPVDTDGQETMPSPLGETAMVDPSDEASVRSVSSRKSTVSIASAKSMVSAKSVASAKSSASNKSAMSLKSVASNKSKGSVKSAASSKSVASRKSTSSRRSTGSVKPAASGNSVSSRKSTSSRRSTGSRRSAHSRASQLSKRAALVSNAPPTIPEEQVVDDSIEQENPEGTPDEQTLFSPATLGSKPRPTDLDANTIDAEQVIHTFSSLGASGSSLGDDEDEVEEADETRALISPPSQTRSQGSSMLRSQSNISAQKSVPESLRAVLSADHVPRVSVNDSLFPPLADEASEATEDDFADDIREEPPMDEEKAPEEPIRSSSSCIESVRKVFTFPDEPELMENMSEEAKAALDRYAASVRHDEETVVTKPGRPAVE